MCSSNGFDFSQEIPKHGSHFLQKYPKHGFVFVIEPKFSGVVWQILGNCKKWAHVSRQIPKRGYPQNDPQKR